MMTLQEQLVEIERMIKDTGPDIPKEDPRLHALRSVAKDLRARLEVPPTVALYLIEQRMRAVYRDGGNPETAKKGLAEEIIARWPIVRRALETADGEAA